MVKVRLVDGRIRHADISASHPAASYGLPVLVDQKDGRAFGPGDVASILSYHPDDLPGLERGGFIQAGAL